jgi:hypothetical protein
VFYVVIERLRERWNPAAHHDEPAPHIPYLLAANEADDGFAKAAE